MRYCERCGHKPAARKSSLCDECGRTHYVRRTGNVTEFIPKSLEGFLVAASRDCVEAS